MSMTKREKILIVIVLILAVFFVYYMYLLKPRLDESEALKLDIENKKQLIATNEQMQKNVHEIEASTVAAYLRILTSRRRLYILAILCQSTPKN